ncbi:LysR family transcriptional regulator [Pendulispora albinea]|uniref:LysR family transcriptional regulator n=1 Tax=Pendulispora albinea TaxID=2741071 RepID=A0ABZ2M3Q4_9BACT
MFDPFTLDQLRAFVSVVEEGSFSAAARKLRRVQSAISTSMANLESQLGLPIWDRSTKIARLTDEGQAVLAGARRVLIEVDALKRRTAGMAMGLEASVSLCVDALFPVGALTDVCARFAEEFSAVDLRVDTQLLSAVSNRVLQGAATLGVVAPPGLAPGLECKAIAEVRMLPVTGPGHPLARLRAPIPMIRMADAVQIVLSERPAPSDAPSDPRAGTGVEDQGVLSPRTWRVADLHTKHAMLRANLGWGNLPEHLVKEDLREGRLVNIRPEVWPTGELMLRLFAIYRSDTTFGPAHRWLLEQLERSCAGSTARPKRPRRSSRSSHR